MKRLLYFWMSLGFSLNSFAYVCKGNNQYSKFQFSYDIMKNVGYLDQVATKLDGKVVYYQYQFSCDLSIPENIDCQTKSGVMFITGSIGTGFVKLEWINGKYVILNCLR